MVRTHRLIGLLIILLIMTGLERSCPAKDFQTLHYTYDDGLPSNVVYSVLRDHQGFLWIFTDKGLARFNGIKFEKYTSYDGLPDNEIFFGVEDAYNRIWLATYNGDLCYYKDGVFHTAKNTPFLKVNIKASHTWIIVPQPDSSIILTYKSNAKFIEFRNERSKVIDVKTITPSEGNFCVNKISEDRYDILCPESSYTINSSGDILSTRSNNCSGRDCFLGLRWDEQRCYLFSKEYIYDRYLQIINRNKINFDHILVNSVYFDKQFFYGTDVGLFYDTVNILKNVKVSGITQDIDGNYWISSLDNGIYCLKNNFYDSKIYVNSYQYAVQQARLVGKAIIFATAENKIYSLKNNNIINVYSPSLHDIGASPQIKLPFSVDSGNIYYGCYAGKLFAADLKTGVEKTSKKINLSPKDVIVQDNNLYCRLIVSIAVYDKKNMAVRKDIQQHERIFFMAKSEQGDIWYSTIDSVYKIDKTSLEKRVQKQFAGITLKYFTFWNNHLVGYTHHNELLICSNYDKSAPSIDTIPARNCIWENFYPLDRSHLLISTNNFYRLLTIDSGTQKETLQTLENSFLPLHTESICADGDYCYFFKSGSITCVKKNGLFERPVVPKVYLLSLKTNRDYSITTGNLDIPYSESKNIKISFSSLSFTAQNVSYQYSFSKSDTNNWIDAGSETINFVSPGYGVYTLKIRARTITSDYSAPVVFILHNLRPFWATWWFITLTICAIVILISMAVRIRLAYVFRKKEEQHSNEIKFLKSEYKAHNALMNPHFIFNSLNNVQSLINKNDNRSANKYLGIFASLIRQNMLNVSKGLVPLQKELDIVTNYLELEKLRFKDWLDYSINVDDNVDLADIMIPPLLIQPLVENSIKHGILPRKSADGFISIDIYHEHEDLVIAVKDNGIGIEAAKKNADEAHESFGLDNTRKRIAQLATIQNKHIDLKISEIKDDTGNLQWTIVAITISN